MNKIVFYTDGSCRGNGQEKSFGGYGVVEGIESEKGFQVLSVYSDQEDNTTNNRMELKALLYALRSAYEKADKNAAFFATIYSDSAYCVNMFNNWIRSWARNNWTRSKGLPIENLDLVKEIYKYAVIDFPPFEVVKIKGHAGHIGNEIADAAATGDEKKLKEWLAKSELQKQSKRYLLSFEDIF